MWELVCRTNSYLVCPRSAVAEPLCAPAQVSLEESQWTDMEEVMGKLDKLTPRASAARAVALGEVTPMGSEPVPLTVLRYGAGCSSNARWPARSPRQGRRSPTSWTPERCCCDGLLSDRLPPEIVCVELV